MTVTATPPGGRGEVVRRVRDLIRVEVTSAASAATVRPPVAAEGELMKRYGVARDVVRDALALLTDEGLIERRRGVGTHARADPRPYSAYLPPADEPLDTRHGVGPMGSRLRDWAWVRTPPVVAAKLDGVAPGERSLCIDYLVVRDGTPLAAVTNYLRAAEAEGLRPEHFVRDFYALIEGGSGRIGSHDITLQATIADPHIAALLEVAAGEAVLWMEQIIRDVDGEAIDFAMIHSRRELRMGIDALPHLDATGLRAAPRRP